MQKEREKNLVSSMVTKAIAGPVGSMIMQNLLIHSFIQLYLALKIIKVRILLFCK